MPQRALGGFATTMSEMLGPRETHAFGILAYHRITEPIPGRAQPTWNVPPERFRQQLEGLCDRGFRAWPLTAVLRYVREGKPIPRKVFVVTFDRGYENVYLQAFPILRQLEVPATVFLDTHYLDATEPFRSDDWEEAGSGNVPYTAWRPISTEECIELKKCGLVELGAQTRIYADVVGRHEALVDDLRRCRRVLSERLNVERPGFALPFGAADEGLKAEELAAAAHEAGLSCALTTAGRLVRPGDSPFQWGRFAAEEHDTAASLAAKLSGWYEAVHALSRTLLGRRPRVAPTPRQVPGEPETEQEELVT
jgi:peptidoglycan/xylan/chitin deacetylase (PgdA/CDA1 family)